MSNFFDELKSSHIDILFSKNYFHFELSTLWIYAFQKYLYSINLFEHAVVSQLMNGGSSLQFFEDFTP